MLNQTEINMFCHSAIICVTRIPGNIRFRFSVYVGKISLLTVCICSTVKVFLLNIMFLLYKIKGMAFVHAIYGQ